MQPIVRQEDGQTKTHPVKKVLRDGQGDPRTLTRQCRVSHHVTLHWFYKGYTRILASAPTVRSHFIIRFGFQSDTQAFNSVRISVIIEADARDADSRIIVSSHQSREEIKLPIGAADCSRVQDTFYFQRVAGFRLHQHSKTMCLKTHW